MSFASLSSLASAVFNNSEKVAAVESLSGKLSSLHILFSSLIVLRPALCSGSLNMISSAITLAPAMARLLTPWAIILLGQGKRPISAKSSSLMTTSSMSGHLSSDALIFERRSKVFFSITSVKSPKPVTNMTTKRRVRIRPINHPGIPVLGSITPPCYSKW